VKPPMGVVPLLYCLHCGLKKEHTGAEETVQPGRVEVLRLGDRHSDTGVRCEERDSIADHLILKILADWKICQHWNLNITYGQSVLTFTICQYLAICPDN